MDGGTVWGTNLVSVVDRCREKVESDSEIIIDIILCYNSQMQTITETGNAIDNFMRHRDINAYYNMMNNIVEFKRSRPDVQYRYLIVPSGKVPNSLGQLQFT